MSDTVEALTRLDVYLAATMRASGDLTKLLRKWNLSNQLLEKERRAAKAAGFSDPSRVTADAVQQYFGPPGVRKPDALEYELTMWPDHVFRWGIYSVVYASHDGFVLKVPRPVPTWTAGNWETSRESLRTWHDTQAEVQAALGEPAFELSWGSTSEWLYESQAGGADLMCEFDYALLTRIVSRVGLVADHRAR